MSSPHLRGSSGFVHCGVAAGLAFDLREIILYSPPTSGVSLLTVTLSPAKVVDQLKPSRPPKSAPPHYSPSVENPLILLWPAST